MLTLVNSGQHQGHLPVRTRDGPLSSRSQPPFTLVSIQQSQARKCPPQRAQHDIASIGPVSRLVPGQGKNAITPLVTAQEPEQRKLLAISSCESRRPIR